MVDITFKTYTLRKAIATAIVKVSKQETIDAIINRQVPKGDVFEMAKAAGLLGVKKTPDLLPDCHPLPIEFTAIRYRIDGLEIHIELEVHTIYKTGVEVEAMHGASVVALTMYDMLKPIDKGIEISTMRLIEKKGGKSDFKDKFKNRKDLKAAVIVCSDTISTGQKEDKAGKAIIAKLKTCGVEIGAYEIIPDEKDQIQNCVHRFSKDKYNLLIYTGGTGLSARDVTPESIEPLLDRRIRGIEESIRNYGQDRTPYSMLSRSVAGVKGNMLILALPGSTNGAKESMDAIFPHVLHIFGILNGNRHD
ncbi:MAG: bifunctional molybdenum cofactor biosynthesis protein MoaC/MoaB [Crocinitomix sp.]|jgi:cyclic pyranopterin phosphate synthase|nr:bifunctional molybdenum cofactor biosynthesis protein MoaC/MoaB [Crocinitomix sp.]